MSAALTAPRPKPMTNTDFMRPLTVAVAGNPNAGKTSLFNALTGLKQKVANYPGVTVESKIGMWPLSDLSPACLIDLPGLYSLDATSVDEEIARDILTGQLEESVTPDVVVAVVDATNLARNLYLTTQLIETGIPVVVALTMFDIAERNKVKIDLNKLRAALGVPVIVCVSRRRRGLDDLANAVLRIARENNFVRRRPVEIERQVDLRQRQSKLIKRYALIEQLVAETVEIDDEKQQNVSEQIDRIVTHRVFGPLILLLVMTAVFQTIFSWASLPMNLIDQLFGAFSTAVRTNLPAGVLTDLIADGIIAGVGGVLVFLPQIFLLFLFISLLEDSGYMARATFLMDRLMRSFGLHGKAFMPLLSSFACAVPGIMATRTIENPKDRLATTMIAPFMSCSARLPVYTLMIATVFAGHTVLGFISFGVLVILGMYLFGIAVALVVATILKRTILKSAAASFVMELPPYRLPIVSNVAHSITSSVGVFLKKAGTVILAISILLWALVAFPRAANTNPGQQVRNSYAGQAGQLMEPLIEPLGFDWRIGIGLIASFAARETIVSTLSVVYNVGADSTEQPTTLIHALRDAKRDDGSPVWTPLVALSLMIFFLLACQCMSTVAIVRRETNSWRWPLFMVGYMLALAYVASLITYQGGRLLGFS